VVLKEQSELNTNRQASQNSRNQWWINDNDTSLYSTVEKQREREKPCNRKYMTDTNLHRAMKLVRSLEISHL